MNLNLNNFLKACLGICYLNITSLLRSPLWIPSMLLPPLAMVIIFFIIGGKPLAIHALIGAVIASTANTGLYLPRLVILLKHSQLQDIFVASPVGKFSYMTGLALSRLIGSSPAILTFITALLIIKPVDASKISVLLLLIFLTWLMCCLIGFSIATYIKNIVHADAISNLLSLALILLPPIYYPLNLLSKNIYAYTIALAIPTTHLAEAARIFVLESPPPINPSIHTLSIIVYIIIFAILSSRSRWREP